MENISVTGEFGRKPVLSFDGTPSDELVVEVLHAGDGQVVEAGDTITCHYYGAVFGSKADFDNSFDRGGALSFQIVVTTATGYMGGHSPNPTYEQVCSHSTGHAETVRVVFDTALTSAADLVRLFFEIHDPTQVGGQGNDIGDQYRSAIWTTTESQLHDATALRAAYQEVLTERGFGPIQTDISAAPDGDSTARFWYAEDYHQQYLFKNPGGYECHARTGIACPALPHE